MALAYEWLIKFSMALGPGIMAVPVIRLCAQTIAILALVEAVLSPINFGRFDVELGEYHQLPEQHCHLIIHGNR